MTFLIIYGIMAAISFVAFDVITKIAANNVYRTNYLKVLLMALLWPLTWVAAIIHAIVVSKE